MLILQIIAVIYPKTPCNFFALSIFIVDPLVNTNHRNPTPNKVCTLIITSDNSPTK